MNEVVTQKPTSEQLMHETRKAAFLEENRITVYQLMIIQNRSTPAQPAIHSTAISFTPNLATVE